MTSCSGYIQVVLQVSLLSLSTHVSVFQLRAVGGPSLRRSSSGSAAALPECPRSVSACSAILRASKLCLQFRGALLPSAVFTIPACKLIVPTFDGADAPELLTGDEIAAISAITPIFERPNVRFVISPSMTRANVR